jgi:hypothetical protein
MARVAPLIVLVHSPNLGPATWTPVAAALAATGHEVVVPSLAGFAAGGPPYVPRLVSLIAGQVPPSRATISSWSPTLARASSSRPLAYFEEALPALPDGCPPCHAAYLAFSEPYRREAGAAAHAG